MAEKFFHGNNYSRKKIFLRTLINVTISHLSILGFLTSSYLLIFISFYTNIYIYIYIYIYIIFFSFPGSSVVKNPPTNAGDTGDTVSILRSGRSPGEGNGNPLQYFCLENCMDRGAWQGIVHGITKSQI